MSRPVNVEIILMNWLTTNRYDGLFNDDADCACERNDLAPCENIQLGCRPGYKAPCPDDCGEHDWHIEKEKP